MKRTQETTYSTSWSRTKFDNSKNMPSIASLDVKSRLTWVMNDRLWIFLQYILADRGLLLKLTSQKHTSNIVRH